MLRSRIRVLAALALVLGAEASSAWHPGPRPIAAGGGEIVVVSPGAGEILAGGTLARIEWAPGPSFDTLGVVEEWEGFLSLDDGTSFPYRLTPHLDLAQRVFFFRVPSVPSGHVRLLLRFGDERREIEVGVPWDLEIVASSHPSCAGALIVPGRGEAARMGKAGVRSWLSGGRDGSALREYETSSSGLDLRAASHGAPPLLLLAESPPPAASLGRPQSRLTPNLFPPQNVALIAAQPGESARSGVPVRLIISRFNE